MMSIGNQKNLSLMERDVSPNQDTYLSCNEKEVSP